MLDQLPHLIWLGLIVTTLDVDNALYMTSATQGRAEDEQKRLIFWGLGAEYIVRIALLLVAFFLASGKEVFFSISGFDVTPQVIALLGAGAFLFLSSAGDLNDVLASKGVDAQEQNSTARSTFSELLLQMTIVNAVLSIDTVIAVADMTDKLAGAVIILAVSAAIRFLFVRQIAGFIARHPETKIVILAFLTLIGLQLILQAFHDELPESAFNIVMAVAIVTALIRRHYATTHSSAAGGSVRTRISP